MSWLYNLLVKDFNSEVKDGVKQAITAGVETGINVQLNQFFQTNLSSSVDIGGGKAKVGIKTNVTDINANLKPVSTISLGDLASVFNPTTNAPCPIQPMTALPNATSRSASNGSMIQLVISDSTMGCAAWVSYSNGALEFPSMPAGTTDKPWAAIVPKLAMKFPHAPVVLDISPR